MVLLHSRALSVFLGRPKHASLIEVVLVVLVVTGPNELSYLYQAMTESAADVRCGSLGILVVHKTKQLSEVKIIMPFTISDSSLMTELKNSFSRSFAQYLGEMV